MKAIILHESKGRIRFRIGQKKMTLQEADVLENWFQKKSWITQVTVHERTGCVILQYSGSRKEVLAAIREFNLQEAQSQIKMCIRDSSPALRESQPAMWARTSCVPMPGYVWKGPSSPLPVSSFPLWRLLRQRSILTSQR